MTCSISTSMAATPMPLTEHPASPAAAPPQANAVREEVVPITTPSQDAVVAQLTKAIDQLTEAVAHLRGTGLGSGTALQAQEAQLMDRADALREAIPILTPSPDVEQLDAYYAAREGEPLP